MVARAKTSNAIAEHSADNLKKLAFDIACGVPDPEIPVVNLGELGVVRGVSMGDDNQLVVKLSPTYSGCPALQLIEDEVASALARAGLDCRVERVISPAWTTDWISDAGCEKLRAYGIAPPQKSTSLKPALFETSTPHCPRCDSTDTQLVSQFGSTPCKAHYTCKSCHEPFDLFKCI